MLSNLAYLAASLIAIVVIVKTATTTPAAITLCLLLIALMARSCDAQGQPHGAPPGDRRHHGLDPAASTALTARSGLSFTSFALILTIASLMSESNSSPGNGRRLSGG